MKLSHSKASRARQCWKKYDFRYNKHLKPKSKHPKMFLGKIYHKALHLHNSGAYQSEVLDYINDEYNSLISEAEFVDQESLLLDKYTCVGMYLSYPWKELTQWEELYPEEEFEVELTDEVQYRGRVDKLVKWNGHWWLWEYKTTGLYEKAFQQRCDVSPQCAGNIWAVAKERELPIAGMIFDGVRRPKLRKRKSEDTDEFGERIQQNYLDRAEFYHLRYPVYKQPKDIDLWYADTCQLASDILTREETGEWYRNTESCYRFFSECPYKKICMSSEPDPLTVELYFDNTHEGGTDDANTENTEEERDNKS